MHLYNAWDYKWHARDRKKDREAERERDRETDRPTHSQESRSFDKETRLTRDFR